MSVELGRRRGEIRLLLILMPRLSLWLFTHIDANFVLPGPTLAPDEDCLHLGAERLLPDDPELQGQARMCGHASAFAVTAIKTNIHVIRWNFHFYLRVKSWSGVLDLLNEARHVLEEEIVKMFFLHVPELEGRLVASAHHPDSVCELEGALSEQEEVIFSTVCPSPSPHSCRSLCRPHTHAQTMGKQGWILSLILSFDLFSSEKNNVLSFNIILNTFGKCGKIKSFWAESGF